MWGMYARDTVRWLELSFDSYILPTQRDYPQTGLFIAELACRRIVICDYG
jgi:hypothetical protein